MSASFSASSLYTLLVNLFSMAGVPPLAGFYAKVYVFFSAIEISLNILVIIGILLSVISAFYYIRFIKIIYFDNSPKPAILDKVLALFEIFLKPLPFPKS